MWQKGMSLTEDIYDITGAFPESERFGMTSQIRRSSVSIPTNIAEGHGRGSKDDFARFLYIALGSARELETLLLLSQRIGLIGYDAPHIQQVQEISRMLTALIRTLKTKD